MKEVQWRRKTGSLTVIEETEILRECKEKSWRRKEAQDRANPATECPEEKKPATGSWKTSAVERRERDRQKEKELEREKEQQKTVQQKEGYKNEEKMERGEYHPRPHCPWKPT